MNAALWCTLCAFFIATSAWSTDIPLPRCDPRRLSGEHRSVKPKALDVTMFAGTWRGLLHGTGGVGIRRDCAWTQEVRIDISRSGTSVQFKSGKAWSVFDGDATILIKGNTVVVSASRTASDRPWSEAWIFTLQPATEQSVLVTWSRSVQDYSSHPGTYTLTATGTLRRLDILD